MTAPVDSIMVIMILTNLLLLGSSRLRVCIRITALQGIMAGMLPLAVGGISVPLRLVAIGAISACLKGLVFPYLLNRNMRSIHISREIQPFIGYTASIIIGVLSLVASFRLDAAIQLSTGPESHLIVPVALFTLFTGLFLITARKKAITQVLGYIILENGIYAFGFAIVRDIPVIAELGVLLDLFVAVFVMGIAIYHINREFDHIDSDQLSILKD